MMSKGNFCPLINKKCVEHKCAWYTHIVGNNPNTGEQVNEWACTISFLPLLMIENSKQQSTTSSAVESLRNETVKQQTIMNHALHASLEVQMHQAQIEPAQIKLLSSDTEQGKS